MLPVQQKWLEVCANEVGYYEKASRSQLYDKTANAGYNNYTKYWEDTLPSFQGQPWCADYISWTLMKTVGKANAAKMLKHWVYTGCMYISKLFTLNANPKVCDIVLFWRNGAFQHTGVVCYVSGDYFETYEGNTSAGSSIVPNGGGVYRKSYYNSKLPGTKFITLDWSIVASMYADTDISDAEYTTIQNILTANANRMKAIDEEIDRMNNNEIFNKLTEVPEWAQPVIGSLMNVGMLKGINDDGDLALDYRLIRQLVSNYRGGAYDKALLVKRNENNEIIESPIVNGFMLKTR